MRPAIVRQQSESSRALEALRMAPILGMKTACAAGNDVRRRRRFDNLKAGTQRFAAARVFERASELAVNGFASVASRARARWIKIVGRGI